MGAWMTHMMSWNIPPFMIILALILQRWNRGNLLGVMMEIIFHLTCRLPLKRFIRWTRRTNPVESNINPADTYTAEATIHIVRRILTLPFSTVNRLIESQSNLACAVHRSVVSPVDSMKTNLLSNSVWFGSSDLNDSTFVLIYSHGGGYCCGSSKMYPAFFSQIIDGCLQAGVSLRILSVEYPLAKDDPDGANGFQLAIRTMLAAFDYLIEEVGIPARNIQIGGDSAGGGLALSTCLALIQRLNEEFDRLDESSHSLARHPTSDGAIPAALVLISPWTNLTDSSCVFSKTPRAVENEQHDLLSYDILQRFRTCYLRNSNTYANQRRERGEPVEFDLQRNRNSSISSSATHSPRPTQSVDNGRTSPTNNACTRRTSLPFVEPARPTSTAGRSIIGSSDSILPSHPLISPILADLSGLPPVGIASGGREILMPDIEQLIADLDACDVPVTEFNHPLQVHNWVTNSDAFGIVASQAVTKMVAFMIDAFRQNAQRQGHPTDMKRNLFSTAQFA